MYQDTKKLTLIDIRNIMDIYKKTQRERKKKNK